MTRIQRQACLAAGKILFGRNPVMMGGRPFARAMSRRGSSGAWKLIELSDRQVFRLALLIRTYRRQVGDPNLLFWAQRTLVEASLSFHEELIDGKSG
jgi:hypothetical protein